jgi:hypothetical protein
MRERVFCLLSLFLLCQNSFAQTASNTIFDQIVGSKMPDTIDGLIEKLTDRKELPATKRPPGSSNSTVFLGPSITSNSVSSADIPFSRSLQAPFSSLENPRTIYAVQIRGGENDPATFVGYSSISKQAEVLSWNPKDGRYEFKLIEARL